MKITKLLLISALFSTVSSLNASFDFSFGFPQDIANPHDWTSINNAADTNNLTVNQDFATGNGSDSIKLRLGNGAHSTNYDGYGTGTNSAHLDANFIKLGNTNNQMLLDMKIVNNTSDAMILKTINFKAKTQITANHRNQMGLVYIGAGGNLLKGTVTDGAWDGGNDGEVTNLKTMGYQTWAAEEGTGSKDFSISLADQLSGVGVGYRAILNAGDSAVFRFVPKYNGTTSGRTGQMQLDNISLTATVIPEPSTYALLAGFTAFLFIAIKRRK